MGGIMKWMLGAAIVAGTLGMAAAPAQAARIGVYVGAPAAYIPPCPGPGYVWVGGYWANGYWVPGYWNFVNIGGPVIRGGVVLRRGPVYGRHFAPEHFRR